MFQASETGVETGAPIELYEFSWGPYESNTARLTNNYEDINHDGHTWTAVPINRRSFEATGKADVDSLEIRLDRSADLANLFIDWPPMQQIAVLIFAGHVMSGEFASIWSGRVMNSGFERNELILTCESTIVSLQRPGLRRHYQKSCPYVLYGNYCGARFNAAQALVDVQGYTADGNVILPADWWQNLAGRPANRDPLPGPGVYTGGIVKWNSSYGKESRFIKRAGSNTLEIVGTWREANVGKQLQIALGCNHTYSHCLRLHDNAINFGGQPWIPLDNPVRQHKFW